MTRVIRGFAEILATFYKNRYFDRELAAEAKSKGDAEYQRMKESYWATYEQIGEVTDIIDICEEALRSNDWPTHNDAVGDNGQTSPTPANTAQTIKVESTEPPEVPPGPSRPTRSVARGSSARKRRRELQAEEDADTAGGRMKRGGIVGASNTKSSSGGRYRHREKRRSRAKVARELIISPEI